MSRQKQNLLWLMIICCTQCQISCSKKLQIIQVNLTQTHFWNSSSSYTAIDLTCKSDPNFWGYLESSQYLGLNIKLNISSQGQSKSYQFKIKKNDNYEVRMNETVEGTKLLLLEDNCLKDSKSAGATANDPSIVTCQIEKRNCMTFSSLPLNIVCQPNAILRVKSQDCLQILDLNPMETCGNAINDNNGICKGSKYRYILKLEESKWTCFKCDNITDGESSTDEFEENSTNSFTAGKHDPPNTLNDMESKMVVMENNNITIAAYVMDDVVGLLHVQDKNTETKDICYSSEDDMINVGDCQNDLKAGFPWSVKIPGEAFNKSRRENNGRAYVGILPFKNMNETKSYTVLNNEVYGITMRAKISNLTDNIDMVFTQNNLDEIAFCVSWDGKGELKWTTSGCDTEIDNSTIKCSCSHLTFFAVLMIPQSVNPVQDLESLTLITSIGCGISMFFMAIALFMHYLLRKAKSNQATKILMNMFVALSLLNGSFLSNESVANTGDNAACVFIALLLHYSMLASFTWFFIQALHMYLWLIRQNVSITNYMRKITVLGWAFPAPAVIAIASTGEYTTVIIKSTSGKISRMCWITNPVILYIVNIGYYALVFIFTTGIFITILTRVVQARRLRAIDGKRKTFRKQLMMVLSLFLLFGLTWSVAFFSYGPMLVPSYYIFTVLNSFQGFFLFLYYYYIHNDIEGRFSDDPRSSGSTTTMVPPNMNGLENVYNYPN